MKNLAVLLAATLVGCGQDAVSPPPGAVLSEISVTPANTSVQVGQTVDFAALGINTDGSSAAVAVTWTTMDESIAAIDIDGRATGISQGTVAILATQGLLTASALLNVTPLPPPPPEIITTSLPDAANGATYYARVVSINGSGTESWSIILGTLPAGLLLDEVSGVISGTATMSGTFVFTVQVSAGGIDTQELTLTVLALKSPPPPVVE